MGIDSSVTLDRRTDARTQVDASQAEGSRQEPIDTQYAEFKTMPGITNPIGSSHGMYSIFLNVGLPRVMPLASACRPVSVRDGRSYLGRQFAAPRHGRI